MKKLKVLVIVMFSSVMMAFGQDAKADAILEAMSAKYKKMQTFKADFSYATVSSAGKIGRKRTGQIAVKGVKFKLNMVGQEIYNNGSEIYSFVKETNEVNITEYDDSADSQFSPANIYNIYKKGYKYKYNGSTNISGTSYDVVELVPIKKNNVSKVELVVDKNSKILKRWKLWDSSGKQTVFDVSNFVANPTLSDNYFKFNTANYPGVEVVDLR